MQLQIILKFHKDTSLLLSQMGIKVFSPTCYGCLIEIKWLWYAHELANNNLFGRQQSLQCVYSCAPLLIWDARPYMLELNNQTLQRKFLEILAFTSSIRSQGWKCWLCWIASVYLTSGCEKEPGGKKAPRRNGWFSHMANSVWLHWGTREYLNKQCTVQWSDVYLQYPWHHALSIKWLLRMDAEINPPPKIKMWENISHECVLNCKQCSYISYEYTYYGPCGGVTWGTSVPCCMSDSVVFPAALWAYLWGPLEGSL